MEAPPPELNTQQLDYIECGQQLTEKDGGTDTDEIDLPDVPPPLLAKSMSKRPPLTDDDSDFDSDVMVRRTAKRKATKGQKWDERTEKLPTIPRPQKNMLADPIDARNKAMDLRSTKLDLRRLKYESEARRHNQEVALKMKELDVSLERDRLAIRRMELELEMTRTGSSKGAAAATSVTIEKEGSFNEVEEASKTITETTTETFI